MSYQDWEPVVLKPSHQKKQKKNEKVIPGQVESVKKYNAGTNKQKQTAVSARKLEDEDGDLHIEKVELSLSRKIQQTRQAKGMTQKQLAQAINEKQTVINDYESGKAIPNQQILGKLERALGCKLRGGPKKKKKPVIAEDDD